MNDVEQARNDYDGWRFVSAMHRYHDRGGIPGCGVCRVIGLQLDAASIASDNAVAEWWAGRYPRLMSREFPLG